MGRLTLNILLSFAQFEREIISERTRDKIAAARKKGKWSGGMPLLGYDIVTAPAGSKLVVNEDEAHRVRQIFELYLQHQALIPVVRELAERGWSNKRWTTRAGTERGGRPFDKGTLYHLLTNRTYTGVVAYQGQAYAGEHTAIIEPTLFDRVRAVLGRNGNTAGATVRNRYGALLKGLLHCGCCRCAMIHTYSVKAEGKRYRYYVCLAAQKKGWDVCATKSVPAGEMEAFVVEQIKRVGSDRAVLEGTLRMMRQQQDKALADLRAEQKAAERELARHHLALRKLAAAPDADRLAALNDDVQRAERRATELRERTVKLEHEHVDPGALRTALTSFAPVWEQLAPKEQARVIQLLVERVDYDGAAGTIAVTFHPSGIKALASEQLHEVAA